MDFELERTGGLWVMSHAVCYEAEQSLRLKGDWFVFTSVIDDPQMSSIVCALNKDASRNKGHRY